MVLTHYKQTKYFSLNTNDKIDNMKWNIPNYNFSQKAKMALVGVGNATNSNLNLTFCPTIKSGFYSSLNTYPLIYSGIGYNNQNIINGKQYYDVNGAFLNEIELKTYSSPPQNDFSYPELNGLKPIIWYKFDDSTNVGLDSMGKANAVQDGGNAVLSYTSTTSVKGTGSLVSTSSSQTLVATYNFSDITDAITISFWLRINGLTTYWDMILLYYGGSDTKFHIGRYGSSSNFEIVLFNSGITNGTHFNGLFVADNTWKHYTIVAEKSGTAVKITSYSNGVFNATSTSGTWDSSGISSFNISTNTPPFNLLGFTGNLDDMRFYNKALTPDQIKELYGYRQSYPIIKNESYKLELDKSINNDPNIHTIPEVWGRFDTGAIGITYGTIPAVLNNLSSAVVNSGIFVKGNNSANFTGAIYLYNNFNFPSLSSRTFSASVWIYPTALPNGTVLSFGNSATAYNNLFMGFSGGVYYMNNLNTEAFSANFSSDLNTWVHLIFIFDSRTLERIIYRNGVKLVLSNPKANGQNNIAGAMQIGAKVGGAYFNGYIDDLRVYYDKYLTEEEITRIYNGIKTNYTTTIENDVNININPNLWCRFETGAITTNSGTDTITLTNVGTIANSGIPIRGNNSASFNATTQYLTGTIENINGNSFSISFWVYIKAKTIWFFSIGNQAVNYKYFHTGYSAGYNYLFNFRGDDSTSVNTFANDLNNWVHLTYVYDFNTKEKMIYRNGVKIEITPQYSTGDLSVSNVLTIGKINLTANYFNGLMDDFRIYTRKVLTQDEIIRIYNGNRLDTTEPLIGMDLTPNIWLKFDTGALLTNDGTDVITLTNSGAVNADVAVRGNNSANFNGSIGIYNNNVITINNKSWSVSAWIYAKVATSCFFHFGSVNSTYQLIWMGKGSANNNEYFIDDYESKAYSTAFPQDVNNWVHLVFMYDVNTKERMIYRNGVKLVLTNPIANGQANTNGHLTLGLLQNIGYFYNGYIDDFRIYNATVLSQAQINDLYNGNTFYNLPTALTRYNTDATNTQYQFEVIDDDIQRISTF